MKTSAVQTFNPTSTKDDNHKDKDNNHNHDKNWVRGVNVGGWLVMERYITPYQFAVRIACAELLLVSRSVAAPNKDSRTKLCDLYKCQPYRPLNVLTRFLHGRMDTAVLK
jgi:hypothetical protein